MHSLYQHTQTHMHTHTSLCLCVEYVCVSLFMCVCVYVCVCPGRSEGSDLDRRVPDGDHAGWFRGRHRQGSGDPGGAGPDLGRRLQGGAAGRFQVSTHTHTHTHVNKHTQRLSYPLSLSLLFPDFLCAFRSFNPDPLTRHTFWTIVVGGSIMWTSMYSINQSQVQRYISCKSLAHAKM